MWKKSKILKILVICFIILWFYQYYEYQNLKNIKISTNEFKINKGDNLTTVRNQLCNKKIINNCLDLKIYTYFHKINNIKTWIYYFSWESLTWFFYQLQKWPKIKYVKFTILPWWTKFDIANYIKNKQISQIFLNLMTNKQFIKNIQNNYPFLKEFWKLSSLEGFLYPDTYFFKKSDLKSSLFPQLLIKTAIKNFIKKTKKLNWKNKYNLTKYQILILSSIVQKEERNIQNKPYVANILIRRYKNNWKIWADWTLCYGLKITSKNCSKYMFNKYLQNKSNKYNTRANIWLPPTPVWNPTLGSIKSVIYSKENNYWFYLHWTDGKIHYAKNNAGQTTNKYKYLK